MEVNKLFKTVFFQVFQSFWIKFSLKKILIDSYLLFLKQNLFYYSTQTL